MSTLSVTNPGTHNGAVGESASLQIQASGLPSGDTWIYSATGLPSGLSINTRSGLISGKISGARAMPSRSLLATARGPAQAEFHLERGATTSTVTLEPILRYMDIR